MLRQAIVAAGGKGTRLGALAKKHGNKSLVSIDGMPILSYTIKWLQEANVQEIIISVNYVREYTQIAAMFEKESRITVVYNRFQKSSAQCLFPLRDLLDKRFFFVYGHAPVPPEHLEKLFNAAKEGVVVSLYPKTTQSSKNKKAARIEKGSVLLEENASLFIEPPHILTSEFVELLRKTGKWKSSFYRYNGILTGVQADHPPEFHYLKDFATFRKFMKTFLIKKG